jgi:integrase
VADPTAGLEAYDRGTPRDRVLTVEEIETLGRWLDTDALSLEAADILKLELLLGARCGEISGLRAEEIDRNKWVWTCLPHARRMGGSASRRSRASRARWSNNGYLVSRGTPVPAGERRGRDLGSCRPLSADAPDSIADWRIHFA